MRQWSDLFGLQTFFGSRLRAKFAVPIAHLCNTSTVFLNLINPVLHRLFKYPICTFILRGLFASPLCKLNRACRTKIFGGIVGLIQNF